MTEKRKFSRFIEILNAGHWRGYEEDDFKFEIQPNAKKNLKTVQIEITYEIEESKNEH